MSCCFHVLFYCRKIFSTRARLMLAAHDIHPNYVEIKEKGVNNSKQHQFLESWHSEVDKNSINKKKEFPRVYKAFVKQNAYRNNYVSTRTFMHFYSDEGHSQ